MLAERLLLACLLGAAIGWNRQAKGKAAGLRTHMLVSLGAALFVMVPLSLGATAVDATSRTIQGVATGIGFLGAGEIIHESRQTTGEARVRGLTSAASVWVTAAIGMLAACGLWRVGLVGTLLTVVILSGAKRLERLIPIQRSQDD